MDNIKINETDANALNKGKQTDRPIIYVAGFPKSGNTWFARLLSNLFESPIVHKDPINSAGMQYRQCGKYVIEKTHAPDIKEINSPSSILAIFYITRDVRDVMVSGFFHNHKKHSECLYQLNSKANIKNLIFRRYFLWNIHRLSECWQGNIVQRLIHITKVLFRGILGKGYSRKKSVGSWSDHVDHWTHNPNVIVVRYEDLLNDTYETLINALARATLPYTAEQVRQSVDEESFSARKNAFAEQGDELNQRFMRSGKAGDWRRFLTEQQAHRIVERHRDAFERMGYVE